MPKTKEQVKYDSSVKRGQIGNVNDTRSDDDDEEEDNPYTMTEEMLRDRLSKRSTGKKWTQVYAGFMGKLTYFN